MPEGTMDIRPLRYFVTIAELGSFSAAARYLNIAQPALSRHIKALEESFGTRLLVRSPRGITITAPGERLFRYGLSILRQVEQVPAVVKDLGQPVTGLVTVGVPSSVSPILSVPLLARARERFPGVRIHLIESLSGYLGEWVQTRRLDLALLFDAEPSPNHHLDPLLVEELCLVGAAEAFPQGQRSIPFARLDRYPLVLPGLSHSLRRLLEAMARSHGIRLDIAYEVDSRTVVLRLARAGQAFAILAEGAVRDEIAEGRLRAPKIVRPSVSRSVSLAASSLPGGTPACEEIRRLIIEVTEDLQKSGVWKSVPKS
ncbi:MAG TPA: LysR substrate-binding domain-containing protein [Acetobacteraceae bacterium]|nr:LysR substrate-binding domain-containing protein [Acetobacteraceae bacterium]